MLKSWLEEALTRRGSIDSRQPLYIQAEHGELSKDGACLRVRVEAAPERRVRLEEISEVVLMGRIAVTTPCLQELFTRAIPVAWCSENGWLYGVGQGLDPGAASLRLAQYRLDDAGALAIAKELIAAKIHNSRVLLRRRQSEGGHIDNPLLDRLARAVDAALRATDIDTLRGVEGAAAAGYFQAFAGLIRCSTPAAAFPGRRRPATDPVNGALSLCYGVLVRATTLALTQAGFDPVYGFLHGPARGRPGLALDMIEPLRSVIADAVVLRLLNTGAIKSSDYQIDAAAPDATQPHPFPRFAAPARRRIIEAIEARLAERPPGNLWRARAPDSYRHLLATQARDLAEHLSTPEKTRFTAYRWR